MPSMRATVPPLCDSNRTVRWQIRYRRKPLQLHAEMKLERPRADCRTLHARDKIPIGMPGTNKRFRPLRRIIMMAVHHEEPDMERDAARAADRIADLTSATFDEVTAYVRGQPALVDLTFPRSLMIYAHAAQFFEQILNKQTGDRAFAETLAAEARARHIEFWQAHGAEHGFEVTDRSGITKVFDAACERIAPTVHAAIDKLADDHPEQGQIDVIVSVLALVIEPPTREEDLVTHVAPLLQPYLTRVEPLMRFLQEANQP
jgi:hypothetical protein